MYDIATYRDHPSWFLIHQKRQTMPQKRSRAGGKMMVGASPNKGRIGIPQGSPTGHTRSRTLAIYQYNTIQYLVSGYNLRADCQWRTLAPPLNSGANAAPTSVLALM